MVTGLERYLKYIVGLMITVRLMIMVTSGEDKITHLRLYLSERVKKSFKSYY
jgi:hypothetical protein